MKKTKKIMLWILPLLVVGCLMATSGVFGVNLGDNLESTLGNTGTAEVGTVTDLTYKIWNTVSIVAQIAAVVAIVFAGVRYMFATADTKADIKKQTVILIVGAILVFGAGLVVSLVNGLVSDLG